MPITRIRDKTQELIDFYNTQSPIGKFFFPRALKTAIENKKSSLEIADAAFKSTWFFHRWIFYPTGLNRFFNDDLIKSAQWLFDPNGIPKNTVGKPTGGGLGALEMSLGAAKADGTPSDIVNEIQALKDYYNSFNPIFRYFFPTSLKKLLDPQDKTLNKNISIIQAVYRDTYFYHRWLFPSVYKRFFKSEAIISAYNNINNHTFPEGTIRVKRNIETLQKLLLNNKQQTTTKKTKAIDINDSLDEAVASIICSLNNPPSLKSNLNAQKMLESIRTIQSARSEGTLQNASHALYLYFKDLPSNSHESSTPSHGDKISAKPVEKIPNHKAFDLIVKAFSETGETSEIYSLLKETPILNKSDAMTRGNILEIININNKGWALNILRLMKDHKLLTDDFTQENFNKITTYHDLKALYDALDKLQINKRLDQETFNKVTVKDGNPTDLADRIITPPEVLVTPIAAATFEAKDNKPAVKITPTMTTPQKPSLISDAVKLATNVYDFLTTPDVNATPKVETKQKPHIEEPIILTEAERVASATLPRPNRQASPIIHQRPNHPRVQVAEHVVDAARIVPPPQPMETAYQRTLRERREMALADPLRAQRLHTNRITPIPIIANEGLHEQNNMEPPALIVPRRPYQRPPQRPYEFNYDFFNQAMRYTLSGINLWAKETTGEQVDRRELPSNVSQVTVRQQQARRPLAVLDIENRAQDAVNIVPPPIGMVPLEPVIAPLEPVIAPLEASVQADDSVEQAPAIIPVQMPDNRIDEIPEQIDRAQPRANHTANNANHYNTIVMGIAFLGFASCLLQNGVSLDFAYGMCMAITNNITSEHLTELSKKLPSIVTHSFLRAAPPVIEQEDNQPDAEPSNPNAL